MTPSELRHYLEQKRQATLADLALHFDSDPEAVRAAMDTWLRKGRASEEKGEGCAKGCCKCDSAAITLYRWNG